MRAYQASILALTLLAISAINLAQPPDSRVLWKFEMRSMPGAAKKYGSGISASKGTIRSIGGTGDVLYIGMLNGTVYAYRAEQGKKPTPDEIKELRTELERMMEEDQRFRTRVMAVEEKYGQNSKELAAPWKEQTEIDNRLLKRLEEIIKQYGWPGVSLVGAQASLAAFLIIQHADYEYQKRYFPLINEAMKKGEIAPGHVALLEDRILMHEGKKQVYGSQLRRNEKTGKL